MISTSNCSLGRAVSRPRRRAAGIFRKIIQTNFLTMCNQWGICMTTWLLLTRARESQLWCLSWRVEVFRSPSTWIRSHFSKNRSHRGFRVSYHVESLGLRHVYATHIKESSIKSTLIPFVMGQRFQKRQLLDNIAFFKNAHSNRGFISSNHVVQSGIYMFIRLLPTRAREHQIWCHSRGLNVFKNDSTSCLNPNSQIKSGQIPPSNSIYENNSARHHFEVRIVRTVHCFREYYSLLNKCRDRRIA